MAKNETRRARKAGQGSKWIRRSTRLAIYARDGFACVYCGDGAEEHGVGLTLDHVVACEHGGTNAPSNLVTCCLSCNSSKQHKTMREWYAHLRTRTTPEEVRRISRRVRRLLNKDIDRAAGRAMAKAREMARKAEWKAEWK